MQLAQQRRDWVGEWSECASERSRLAVLESCGVVERLSFVGQG